MPLNQIAKQSIAEKILKAIKDADISKIEAGRQLGFHSAYLTFMKSPKLYFKMSNESWEIMRHFVNEGKQFVKPDQFVPHSHSEFKKTWEEIKETQVKIKPEKKISEKIEILPELTGEINKKIILYIEIHVSVKYD